MAYDHTNYNHGLFHATRGYFGPHRTSGARKNLSFAVHDAFREARRQLQDYVRCLRGEVKLHDRARPVRAEKLGLDQSLH